MTKNLTKENTDLRAQLIAALQSCSCPRHKSWEDDTLTIGECIGGGWCGCDAGDLIRVSQRITS